MKCTGEGEKPARCPLCHGDIKVKVKVILNEALEIWRIRLEPLPSSSGQSVLSASWPRQEETAPGEAAQMRVGPAVSEPEEGATVDKSKCRFCGLPRINHYDPYHEFVDP